MTKKPLYHLSFKKDLEGFWNPKNPDGIASENTDDLKEPDLPRISVSPTIKQCFQAIYPNVSRFFKEENYPHMDFYVYSPVLKGDERILTPVELTKKKMVHDAHMTDEYYILDRVWMSLIEKIRIFNTNKSSDLFYRPFGDKKQEERFLAPMDVRFQVLKTFNPKLPKGSTAVPLYAKW